MAGTVLLGGVTLALILVGVAVGPYPIPFTHTATALLDRAGLGTTTATATEQSIIEGVRLPRIALALTVGAALATAGATLQGLFRNPMADPGIIGVSAGGALGAVVVIVAGIRFAGPLSLPAAAFVGAIGAAFLIYGIASIGGRFSMAVLLLSGVAVSSFLTAMITAILYFAPTHDVQREVFFWLAGGLDSTLWSDFRLSLVPILLGAGMALVLARDLNLLALGDEEAAALGVRVGLTRSLLIVAASLTTGGAVAFTGNIAFVGLVVPHMVRLVVGPDHRVLVPLSALAGAAFLLLADTIARVLVSPAEVRVGIITAFVGAPFFLFLLIRNKVRADVW
ncbi:MAG: iron chelate uptake ABC transporter family permease subunit [Gemmatimonadetes bacterium]|nr:iron chelate uptake ABC transporter family permease subunit [Gemmatimonadota bacterium]